MNYDNIQDVLEALKSSQDADHDRREKIREIQDFLNAPDGQWEPEIYSRFDGKPRYTFDMCAPVVEQIWGEMAQNDFDIRVRPLGGEASKETAKLFDGLIRNIETLSDASSVYASAGKKGIKYGFGAWRIMQEWADVDAFDQDLFIKEIQNSVDRLWFDAAATQQDMSDAGFCFILDSMSLYSYKRRWKNGSAVSVGTDATHGTYSHKAEKVIVGEFIYKKPIVKTICLMSDGSVLSADDAEKASLSGLTIERTRGRKTYKVCSRFFDGKEWLSESVETVFDHLPVVPVYPNFEVNEEKVVYRGAVERLMDAQRVYNYTESRKVEEVALAPKSKMMMTAEQAKGHTKSLSTMNTNNAPVQFYNHVDGQNPPYQTGGPQMNAGLTEVSQSMTQNIERSSGVFGVNPANNQGLQSNVALERLENRGQIGTFEYFAAQEKAIARTAKILVQAIPKIYDEPRKQRTINEDGSYEMAELNTMVADPSTMQTVKMNDLSLGLYDVTCSIGPAFKNRQQETAKAITELAAIDPTILEDGSDILLSNIDAPSMDLLAERKRQGMLMTGRIPESQLTDEEKQQIAQASQQPQAPDANMVLAQAEATKAEADVMTAQLKAEDQKIKVLEAETKRMALQVKAEIDGFKAQTDRAKVQVAAEEANANISNKEADTLNKQIDATLKTMGG